MHYRFAIMLLLTGWFHLQAQVFEVHGGSSTLFESQGGTLDVKGMSYDASVGAGTIGPRFLGSASFEKHYENSTLTLGTSTIPFNLPTDVFDEDHYLTTIGASLRTSLPAASVLVFGGMMSQNFDGPFFEGARGDQAAAVMLFDGRISPKVSIASRMILAKQITLIESLAWRPVPWAQMAASGGIGSGREYGAVSAKMRYSWVDLKTAYIQAAPGFRRASADSIVTAEPDRLNALVTVTPNRHISASVGHSGYLMPVANSDLDTRSSVDQIETNTQFAGIGLSVSAFHSTYEGGENKALVLTANRNLSRNVHAQGNYLYSTNGHGSETSAVVTNFTETLTPRWTVSQIVNNSNGQSTVGFGTSFISNLVTFSADYQTYYIPSHLPSPFEQVLILNADVNLFGRMTMRGGTFVAPDGSVKHTVAAQGIFARGVPAPASIERNPMGRFVIRGRVLDTFGQPVDGAALLIDGVPAYTDSDGNFVLRERQARFHSLQVLGGHFLDGATYRVVSASTNIRSAPAEENARTIVIVERVLPLCGRGAACKG